MNEHDVKTPMMKQYFDIKAENPGALVMFRLGDFYEFFGEDAHTASRELDIVLTGRDAGMEERMPMCGVPHHALDQYLSRLVQKGYRVCVCEQLEDPKTVKGLVKRGVIRVVTPGTAMEFNGEEETVLIASLLYGGEVRWGLAMCEVSTGQLRIAEFVGSDSLAELTGEVLRQKPKEILISENDYLILAGPIRTWTDEEEEESIVTLLPGSAFDRKASLTLLEKQFENPLWLDYPLAGDCAGAILGYLESTQKASPAQIKEIELEEPGSRLVMDATTFRNLEITRNLRTFDKKGSLLDLLDKTRTAFGARLLRSWLEKPLVNQADIEARLDAVECLYHAWSPRQELRKHLRELYDMERLMTRVVYRRATPRELLALRQSFAALPGIRRAVGEIIGVSAVSAVSADSAGSADSRDFLAPASPAFSGGSIDPTDPADPSGITEPGEPGGSSANHSELLRIYRELDDLGDLHEKLCSALEEDIPNNWKEGGFIRAGYHAEADEYRHNAQNGRTWMLELEQGEREKTGIKSLKVGYNKVFGYYFDVTKSNLSSVPDYFQRKQTLASGERFVTEELIRLEGLVLGAEEKMVALELELYQELLVFLAASLSRVQGTSAALARLDVFQSLAETAAIGQYSRPRLMPADSRTIRIKDLRHPVVEQILDRNRFVPNDLAMDEHTSLFIITGPNMGGKSTYCRSVALAFVMAQTGSFVPAAQAELPIRDRLFARVGASDDLRGGQSTFMMEMNEVAHILRHATEHSFVVLDEVGRGTGTYDGLSVAWAVSQYLVSRIKAKTLFATHYLELTGLEEQSGEVRNLSIVVEEEGERIVFLHKILPGSANKSYGIHVARLAGLPEEVIQGARAKLSSLENEGARIGGAAHNTQLSLFIGEDEAAAASSPGAGKHAGKAQNDSEQKAIKEIRKKDITKMTPIDALNFLYNLQKDLLN